MKIYTYSGARQKLSESASPFDVPGIKTKATTLDILQAAKESRSYSRAAKS